MNEEDSGEAPSRETPLYFYPEYHNAAERQGREGYDPLRALLEEAKNHSRESREWAHRSLESVEASSRRAYATAFLAVLCAILSIIIAGRVKGATDTASMAAMNRLETRVKATELALTASEVKQGQILSEVRSAFRDLGAEAAKTDSRAATALRGVEFASEQSREISARLGTASLQLERLKSELSGAVARIAQVESRVYTTPQGDEALAELRAALARLERELGTLKSNSSSRFELRFTEYRLRADSPHVTLAPRDSFGVRVLNAKQSGEFEVLASGRIGPLPVFAANEPLRLSLKFEVATGSQLTLEIRPGWHDSVVKRVPLSLSNAHGVVVLDGAERRLDYQGEMSYYFRDVESKWTPPDPTIEVSESRYGGAANGEVLRRPLNFWKEAQESAGLRDLIPARVVFEALGDRWPIGTAASHLWHEVRVSITVSDMPKELSLFRSPRNVAMGRALLYGKTASRVSDSGGQSCKLLPLPDMKSDLVAEHLVYYGLGVEVLRSGYRVTFRASGGLGLTLKLVDAFGVEVNRVLR